MISNLLDNAIDAHKHFPPKTQEYTIDLTMRVTRGMLCIQCTNPVNKDKLHIKNGTFVSTKKEPGHGLGLSGIRTIVDTALGNCSFTVEDDHFIAFLALPYMSREELEEIKPRSFVSKLLHKK